MTQVRTMKIAAVSAMVGAVLLLGAFLATYSMAGAQTPSPEPTTPAPTQPAPDKTPDGSDGPRNRADCPKEDGANGESSTGVRGGGGVGGFRQ